MKTTLMALGALALLTGLACGPADDSGSGTVSTLPTTATSTKAPAAVTCPNPKTGQDTFDASDTGATVNQSGLKYIDVKAGTGAKVKIGDQLQMQYTGWLTDGTQFDSSRQAGRTPFSVTIGQGQVIKGWDEGILGMQVCGQRKLIIPPALGYGASGQGSIPANATLIFMVELVSLTSS
ncbi:MAG: FKBP-type peptidyl-prolyl cis-trans isomerase [Candidatus Dormibacteria bacterium]